MNGSDLTSIHLATPLQILFGSLNFDKLALSALPYETMCWLIESEFILSSTNKMPFSISLLQILVRISPIDDEIEIVQHDWNLIKIFVFCTLLIMLEKCRFLICMMLSFISRKQSTIGIESPGSTFTAART
jgi:hypothetical protein